MARWNSRDGEGGRACGTTTPCDHLRRVPQFGKPQDVRVFLRPTQRPRFSIDGQGQVVLITYRNLACPNMAARAAFELQRDAGVIVYLSSRDV